jgi:hypothetical protein
LNVDVRCGLSEEWRCDVEARVPLAEDVVYLSGRKGLPDVEGVEVMVCVADGDEGGEVAVLVYVEDRDEGM